MSNPITTTVVEKLVTTNTTASSLVVGGASPVATTGTGGVNAGTLTGNTSVTDGVGTMATIRAGGIGIASQAALDFIYAASATQLGRIPVTFPLQSTRINAAGTAWEFFPVATTSYTATLANVQNTAADTVTISFTIPSTTMSDGNTIVAYVSALLKNTKGTSGVLNWTLLWGAATTAQFAGPTIGSGATEFKLMFEFRIMRVGADVWVFFPNNNNPGDYPLGVYKDWGVLGGADNVKTIAAATFNSDQVFSIKLQLSAADATFYFKPQSAVVTHFK